MKEAPSLWTDEVHMLRNLFFTFLNLKVKSPLILESSYRAIIMVELWIYYL